MKKKTELFTINQLANLCSISRSTIIRMEEDGILQPAYKNPQTGYRYYDSENAVTVIHNLCMQRLGLTHKEVKKYSPVGDADVFLKILEKKRRELEDLISEIRARLTTTDMFEVEEVTLPRCMYYTKTLKNIKYISVIPGFVRETFDDALNDGFQIEWHLPNCVSLDVSDFLEGRFTDRPHDFTACIPIKQLSGKTHDAKIQIFEPEHCVSVLFSGDALNIRTAAMRLGKYLKEHGLEPCGDGRFMGIINEFPRYFDPENNHAARIIVPVRSKKAD